MAANRAVVVGIHEFRCGQPDLAFGAASALDVRHALEQVNRRDRSYFPALSPPTDLLGLRTSMVEVVEAAATDDVVVAYVISRARRPPDSTTLHILTTDCDTEPGWPVESWLRNVCETRTRPYVLLVLDLVGAPDCAHYLSTILRVLSHEEKVWLLAGCSPDRPGHGGGLSHAVIETLRLLARDGLDTDPALEFVPPARFARVVRRSLAAFMGANRDADFVLDSFADRRRTRAPFFENPLYRPEAAAFRSLTDVEELRAFIDEVGPVFDAAFFVGRAFGQSDPTGSETHGCLFTGRRGLLRLLTRWIEQPRHASDLLVVTGGPGTGKSALLGMVVCAAHPRFPVIMRDRLPGDAELPGACPEIAVLHARDRSVDQLAASIAHQLRLGSPDQEWNAARLVTAMAEREPTSVPPLIILDALDEARRPRDVVDLLVRPLLRASREGNPGRATRVIIGARPWWNQFPGLLADATSAGGMVDLDAVPLGDVRAEVGAYARRFLAGSRHYRDESAAAVREALADIVADTLAPSRDVTLPPTHLGAGAFLVAGLYLNHLAQRARPLRPDELDAARREVPRSLAEVLDLHLAHVGGYWDRPVLVALAHAHGRGIPLGPLAATTLDPVALDPHTSPTTDQVAQILDRLSFYLRRSVDGAEGTTLFRLFHQGLVDHLRTPDPTPGQV